LPLDAPAPTGPQLSQLEQLIRPFAGARAEAVAVLLLHHFGSLRTILTASAEVLARALPDDRAVADRLAGVGHLAAAGLREALHGAPVRSSDADFQQYALVQLGLKREECVLVVFLDKERFYIASEMYDGASRGACTIPVRRLVRRALEIDARRLIIAHNHLSGVTAPSQSDIAATRELGGLLGRLEIHLDDHCIATRHAISSMRLGGLM